MYIPPELQAFVLLTVANGAPVAAAQLDVKGEAVPLDCGYVMRDGERLLCRWLSDY